MPDTWIGGAISVITQEQAKEADYNLSPSRWPGQPGAVVQRPVSEIIADMRPLDEEAREIDASPANMLTKLK